MITSFALFFLRLPHLSLLIKFLTMSLTKNFLDGCINFHYTSYNLFFLKNTLYENTEAQIPQKLRTI